MTANDSNQPNVDRLLARVDADVERDEAWRARRRLKTWMGQFPGQPRLELRLGEMMLEIGEYPAAGKHFWGARSADASHGELVRKHLDGLDERDLLRSIARELMATSELEQLAPIVQAELERRGLSYGEAREKASAFAVPKPEGSILGWGLCILTVVLLVVILGLGAVSLFRLVSQIWN